MKDKKSKKKIIDTYECIYPVDLVVANEFVTLEDLQKLYTYSDKSELDDRIIDKSAYATTTPVIRKSDDKPCVLVKYIDNNCPKNRDKKVNRISTISHEAGHVTLDIYEFIDQHVCNCSSEPFCYLLGWATECIYKTLNK